MKEEKKKKVTAATVKSLYGAAQRAYANSYAMLVDDAFEGGRKRAETKGVGWYYDGGMFSASFGFIRAHRTWDSLTASQRQDIIDAAQED